MEQVATEPPTLPLHADHARDDIVAQGIGGEDREAGACSGACASMVERPACPLETDGRLYRMVLTQRADGRDTATCNGLSASNRTEATMALARALLAAGYTDRPWECYGADGCFRFSGSSIARYAKWTVGESDRGGLQRRLWTPYAPSSGDAQDGFANAACSDAPACEGPACSVAGDRRAA